VYLVEESSGLGCGLVIALLPSTGGTEAASTGRAIGYCT
jgi:hypothetical protein